MIIAKTSSQQSALSTQIQHSAVSTQHSATVFYTVIERFSNLTVSAFQIPNTLHHSRPAVASDRATIFRMRTRLIAIALFASSLLGRAQGP